MEEKNAKYEKRAKKALIISFIVIPLVGYFLIRTLFHEDICTKKAQEIVGSKWTVLVKPTKEEFKQLGWSSNDKIALGFRELLKCERNYSYLIP